MLKRVGIYAGFALLWLGVIAVVVWAERLSSKHRDTTPIQQTEITISGGGSTPLVDKLLIEEWLTTHDMTLRGATLSKADIASIEKALASNSAVESVNVYATYDGDLKIDITQREPIARLRLKGYDMYLTEDGYLLPATDGYSVHVPVITGDYTPLFPPTYTGYAKDVVRDTIAALERRINELEDAKIPHYEDLKENNSRLRKVLRTRIKRGLFTSEQEIELLTQALNESKTKARSDHSVVERDIRAKIATIETMQAEIRYEQKEIGNIDTDFDNLISLLLDIRENDYWRAEVVQIVATGGGSNPMLLSIIPRSGRFTVDLGETERLDEKLRTLRRFYAKGLDRIGWDKYSRISLRYEGQVVCR